MTPERWQQVKELFGVALEQDPEKRSAFLEGACGADAALRAELESLIAEELLAGDFMKGPLVSPRESLTGKTILQYDVTEKLGEGGMGMVYKARDTRLDRFVALKILPPDMLANPDRRRRLVHEAKAASALNHPNIITVHDIVRENGIDFIVMEYVQGSDLQEILRSGKELSLIRKLKIMSQVADGLIYAHGHGVIHRDVKPANIMVLGDGTAKILDFGVARTLDADSTGHTLIGSLVGTLQWISPEQLRGREADALCDVWACGVTFYEMLTGRHPFEASDSVNLMYKITSVEPDPVRSVAPECPGALEKIVMRALAKDRQLRYQSLEELRRDIEPLLLALLRGQAPAESPPTRSRGAVVLWMGTGVLGLVLAVSGAWIYRGWSAAAKPGPAFKAPAVVALPESPAPGPHLPVARVVKLVLPPPRSELEPDEYSGPLWGELSWSGVLKPGGTLQIQGGKGEPGNFTGDLPRVPNAVEIIGDRAAVEIALVEQPSAANRWDRLVLRNVSPSPVTALQIRWRVAK